MKKILFLSIVIALFLSGCFKGQGDVKIKAAVNFLGIEKVIPDLEIYIDNKKMGVTQAGFVTYKIDEGSHTVTLKEENKEFSYDKVYSKTISVAPNSTTELIFDLTKKPKLEMHKSRKENVAKLFKKYNLVGEWQSNYFINNRDGKQASLSLKIKNNGEWEFALNGKYKNKEDMNTLIVDNGKNLSLHSSTGEPFDFKYPEIKDGCFVFDAIGYSYYGQDSFKFCTIKKLKYEYVKDVITYGSDRKILGEFSLPMFSRKNLYSGKNHLITDEEIKIIANYVANGMTGKGKKLFENTCGSCHGDEGKGMEYIAPGITHLTYFPKRHISYKELMSNKYRYSKKSGYYINTNNIPDDYKGKPFDITSKKKMFMSFYTVNAKDYVGLKISKKLFNTLATYPDYIPYLDDYGLLLVKAEKISPNIVKKPYWYQLTLKQGEKFSCDGIIDGQTCMADDLSGLFVENK